MTAATPRPGPASSSARACAMPPGAGSHRRGQGAGPAGARGHGLQGMGRLGVGAHRPGCGGARSVTDADPCLGRGHGRCRAAVGAARCAGACGERRVRAGRASRHRGGLRARGLRRARADDAVRGPCRCRTRGTAPGAAACAGPSGRTWRSASRAPCARPATTMRPSTRSGSARRSGGDLPCPARSGPWPALSVSGRRADGCTWSRRIHGRATMRSPHGRRRCEEAPWRMYAHERAPGRAPRAAVAQVCHQGLADLTGQGVAALTLAGHGHDAGVPIEIVERHRGHFAAAQPGTCMRSAFRPGMILRVARTPFARAVSSVGRASDF